MNHMRKGISKAIRNFGRVRSLARKDGLNLSDAEFIKVECRENGDKGIPGCDAMVVIGYNRRFYQILLNNCMKTEKGWNMFSWMTWRGKM